MKSIAHDPSRCYGCRTCELACSWHTHRVFSPALSKIQVSRDNRTGTSVWSIDDSGCDLCRTEAEPLCVRYCSYEALTVGEAK